MFLTRQKFCCSVTTIAECFSPEKYSALLLPQIIAEYFSPEIYSATTIGECFSPEKYSGVLLPQLPNASATTVAKCFFVVCLFFFCGCRRAELLSGEKHSALVVAEEQEFSLVHEKNSATVVYSRTAESENVRFCTLMSMVLHTMHSDTTKFMLALFSVPGQPILWNPKTGIIRSGATRFGHNTNTIVPTTAAGSLLIMHSHIFFFSMKIYICIPTYELVRKQTDR